MTDEPKNEPAPLAGPLVIVGAGQAGMQLATSLRQLTVAHPITLIGDESEPPYERPPLSKGFLDGSVEAERLFFRKEAAYADHAIDLRLGERVTAIDRHTRTVALRSGETLPYNRLVLATGSRARQLPIPGAALDGVFVLRDLQDARLLKAAVEAKPGARAAVVGGGYIGMEIAASLAKLGASVTVVEALPRVLMRGIARPVAEHLVEAHKAHGVDLQTGVGVDAFVGEDGEVVAVELQDGQRLDADIVVVGVGAAINDELAQDCGLACNGGILTDAYAQTSDPHTFAIGDCSVQDHAFLGRRVRLESVQNAVDQAKAVAKSLAGKPTVHDEVPWFWTQQFDLLVRMVGVGDDGMDWAVRGDPEAGEFALYGLRDGVISAVQAVNSGIDYAVGRRLVRNRVQSSVAELEDMATDLKALAKG